MGKKKIILVGLLALLGLGIGVFAGFFINPARVADDEINTQSTEEADQNAENNGTSFSIVRDEVNGDLPIDVEATSDGRFIRIKYEQFIFVYLSPNLVAYTQDAFHYAYLFRPNTSKVYSSEYGTQEEFEVSKLITIDDYDTAFFPSSQFWAVFSLVKGSVDARIRGELRDGKNDIQPLEIFGNDKKNWVEIADLRGALVDVQIPKELVEFREIIAYEFSKNGSIPYLESAQRGNDARLAALYQEYLQSGIKAESLKEVDLPSSNMFAD